MYDVRFLHVFVSIILMNILSCLTLTTTLKTEEALHEMANRLCLEKTGYQPLENNAFFRVEETPVGGDVKLPCAYCERGEEDIPRIWSRKRREIEAVEKEVAMGLAPNLTENRIFTLPDNSLTIRQVTLNDSGLYYCKSLVEGEFSEFHFSLDVVQSEIPIIEKRFDAADKSNLLEFTEQFVVNGSARIAEDKNIADEFDQVSIKIVSEWDPWLPCDGCIGLRKRYGKCRLRAQLNKAKYPGITEDNLSDHRKLLLRSIVISCHSLDLARWFPSLYKITKDLPNYLDHKTCHDTCTRENRKVYEAKYKLDFRMDAGSSYSFICPDTDLQSKVVWRRDGTKVKKIGTPSKPKKKSKLYNMPFLKKKDFEFLHVFVDRMNVLRMCIVGLEETGIYTCYVNKKPIKTFNITVVTPIEALNERIYHFHLLSGYTISLSGIMVLMGITWGVLKRKDLFPNEGKDKKLSYTSLGGRSRYGHGSPEHHPMDRIFEE